MSAPSPSISIRIRGLDIGDGFPVRIMGVLNLSPESFYAWSVQEISFLADTAKSMVEEGASMLDIGGRSTAPQSAPIEVDEERRRVAEALNALLEGWEPGETLISIDTQYRQVAEIAYGIYDRRGCADRLVLNDVSGLCVDPGMADWIAETGVPAILMASHQRPGDSLGIEETLRDLTASMEMLARKGYPVRERLILDPAVGRWVPAKSANYDFELVREIAAFRRLGQPILVGLSRKGFISSALKAGGAPVPPEERLTGTLAATAVAVFNGAHVIRTHDVTRETRETVLIAQRLRGGW